MTLTTEQFEVSDDEASLEAGLQSFIKILGYRIPSLNKKITFEFSGDTKRTLELSHRNRIKNNTKEFNVFPYAVLGIQSVAIQPERGTFNPIAMRESPGFHKPSKEGITETRFV